MSAETKLLTLYFIRDEGLPRTWYHRAVRIRFFASGNSETFSHADIITANTWPDTSDESSMGEEVEALSPEVSLAIWGAIPGKDLPQNVVTVSGCDGWGTEVVIQRSGDEKKYNWWCEELPKEWARLKALTKLLEELLPPAP